LAIFRDGPASDIETGLPSAAATRDRIRPIGIGNNMFKDNPDSSWEKIAKRDAYFGVLSEEKYRIDRLSADHKEDFFLSGRHHIDKIIEQIEHRFGQFPRRSALDFGCGVGRLVIPLAREFDSVVGIDVSASMIEEAKRNCKAAGIQNIELILSGEGLATEQRRFDFVHTFIVLQHIPANRGVEIIARLVDAVNDGGAAAIHFIFTRETNSVVKLFAKLRKHFKALHYAINILSGQRWDYPQMQMNHYSLNAVLPMLYKKGVKIFAVELTKHTTHYGAVIMFKR
jgi:ubiquinone/menaquinone biosynthesis C-methylase UbiE